MNHRDESFMRRVLELAKRGEGRVSPNPMVGALIVRNGKILAEGWHRRFGGPHAEIEALKQVKSKNLPIAGSALYVNVEPCVHFGKTPPCVPEIIQAKFSRVVIAMKDPNPNVAGRGASALAAAGIGVEVGCLKKEALALNEKFVKWMRTGLPFIGMKVAMSLDGKIATRSGDSKWITSQAARHFVKRLRDTYDAILIGVNTVLRDNPRLTGYAREPLRIILDSSLKIPKKSRVLRNRSVLIVTTAEAPLSKILWLRKREIPLKIFHKKIQLPALLSFLGKQCSSILVEGGSAVFGSFVDARLVDKFYWFIAPKIIGGKNSLPAVGGRGSFFLKKALQLTPFEIERIGPDIFLKTYPTLSTMNSIVVRQRQFKIRAVRGA